MNKEDYFYFGYISRRVGNFGDVAIVMDVDTPTRYQKLESVFIEINNSLIPFFISKLKLSGVNATVTIEGIDTIERAEELIKSAVYLPLSFLPPLKGKQFYFHEMPGYKVFDKVFGEIGIVEKILDMPQQAIFQIKKDKQEILIPAKEEFINSINRDTKELHLNAPEGLIEIYLSPEKNNSEKEKEEE